jgi:hypothetical protein
MIAWTPEKDATLREMWLNGEMLADIGRAIGVSAQAVACRRKRIGLAARDCGDSGIDTIRAPRLDGMRLHKARPLVAQYAEALRHERTREGVTMLAAVLALEAGA